MKLKIDSTSACLITKPENIFYCAGFVGEGFAIITRTTILLATDQRYWLMAKKLKIPLFDLKTGWEKKLRRHLQKLKTIFFEEDHLTVSDLERWKKILPEKQWKKSKKIFSQQRMMKTEREMKKLTMAAKIGDLILKKTFPLIVPGVLEKNIANTIRKYAYELGDGTSFDPIVAFGKNSAVPHHHSGNQKLKKDDAVLIDLGVKYHGYCSDMTRCFFVGKGIEKIKKMYAAIEKAQKLGVSMVKEAVSIVSLDKAVRKKLVQYEKYFTHSLGHGVGLEIHESPSLSKTSKEKLKAGMVITIEPGIYIPNIGGVRIEDTVIVTKHGYKVITKSSKNPILP